MGNLGKFFGLFLFALIATSCADKNDHSGHIEMEAESISEDSLIPVKQTQCASSELHFNLDRTSVQLEQKLQKVVSYTCEGDKLEEKWLEVISPKAEVSFPEIEKRDYKFYAPEYHIINAVTCDKMILKEDKAMKPKIWVDYKSDTAGLHVIQGTNVIQYAISVCSPSKVNCQSRVVVGRGTVVIEVSFKESTAKEKSEYGNCALAY